MPEFFSYAVGIAVALGAVLMIAFPDRFIPETEAKKKRFNARHWGTYTGSEGDEESDEANTVEVVGIPSRKIHNVTGSRTYSGGRGVRM